VHFAYPKEENIDAVLFEPRVRVTKTWITRKIKHKA
jgi:hypothetical protein